MDVVALLVIVLLPLCGITSVPEALAGFSDPIVVLIATLFERQARFRRELLTSRADTELRAGDGC